MFAVTTGRELVLSDLHVHDVCIGLHHAVAHMQSRLEADFITLCLRRGSAARQAGARQGGGGTGDAKVHGSVRKGIEVRCDPIEGAANHPVK